MIPGIWKNAPGLSPFSRNETGVHRIESGSIPAAAAAFWLAVGAIVLAGPGVWAQAPGQGEPGGQAGKAQGSRIEPSVVTLEAADGLRLTGDFYRAGEGERAIALLFHQAGSNAAEYSTIAQRLARLGISSLALDQRSGGNMWGRANCSVFRRGRSSGFLEAHRDLEAALAWAQGAAPRRPVLVWGSSYTAALVFRLASQHGKEITAVLAFSPGEYLGPGEPVRGWAARVRRPIFVASAPGHEVAVARRILDAAPAALKRQFAPERGVHGSSILREDRNPGHTAEAWQAVEEFLAEVLSGAAGQPGS